MDQFLGSGTTLVEAKLLNRNAVGIDINPTALSTSDKNLQFTCENKAKIFIKKGTATHLDMLKDNSIDFICTHPPYADIIKYSSDITEDLSLLKYDDFINEIQKCAREAYRVLREGKKCAIMIGDIRKKGRVVPLGFQLMQCFVNANFKLVEIIIKEQHNCKSTPKWSECKELPFYLLAHEYIFVFEK